jgi:SAM-dependent methyltransferase
MPSIGKDHPVIKSPTNRSLRCVDRQLLENSRPPADPYVLATGKAAEHRLRILHDIYKAGTRRVLLEAGVRSGMRVADIGCGVGMVTEMLAGLVGIDGHVVGIDASAAQLDAARLRLDWSASNTSFVQADALVTGLPAESFDVVYCRFLLLHLPDPQRALREMRRLLRPGGLLVCEDGDLTTAGSEPPSALNAFAELFGRLGPLRGVDYTLGRRLHQMVREAGFVNLEITLNQPAIVRGENKRLLELSVAEAAEAIVAAGLLTAPHMQDTLVEMRQAGDDPCIVALMIRMAQVWARKDNISIRRPAD